MDKSQPWSVKGIDPETRQAAKMAARRSGLTVGAWLNRAIRRAAAEELGTAPPARIERTDLAPLPEPQAQLPAPAMDALLEALRRQTEEVKAAIRDSTEEFRYTADRLQPVVERIRPMSERLEAIAGRLDQVDEVDRRVTEAERKAERAALQVAPLERTLTRLFERMEGEQRLPAADPDGRYRRRGLLGKLFGD